MSEENTEKEYKVGDGLATYKNTPKDASGAIPSYAKALKLLKKKTKSYDEIVKELGEANKISFQLRMKSEVETGEDLNHTNYAYTDNPYLQTTSAYQRKKIETFPLELVKNYKFPIIPFSNDLIDDSGETSYEKFSEVFNKCGEKSFVLGTMNPALVETKTDNSTDKIEVTYSLPRDEISLSNTELFNFLSTNLTNGEKKSLKKLFGDACADYDITLEYRDDDKNKLVKDSSFKEIQRSTTGNEYSFVNDSSSITIQRNDTDSKLTVSPKQPTEKIIKSISFNEKGEITSGFGYEKTYENVSYETYNAVETNNNQVGNYLKKTYPDELKKTLTSEDVEAYTKGESIERADCRETLKKYKELLDLSLSRLDDFYNNHNMYYFNYPESISNGKTGEERKSVQIGCKLDETKSYATLALDLVGFSPSLKKMIALTERDGHNDSQLAEVQIYSRVEDALLNEELFQIYKIEKTDKGLPSKDFYENDKNFFSKNFNDFTEISELKNAHEKSASSGKLNIDDFCNELFSKSSKQPLRAEYDSVSSHQEWKIVNSYTTGWIFKKTHYDWGWVTYYTTTQTTGTLYPNIRNANVVIKPTIDSQIVDKNKTIKIMKYNSENHQFYTVEENAYTTQENKNVSLSYPVEFNSESGQSKDYILPLNKLFYFAYDYKGLIESWFEDYEKNIVSLSLLDILSDDIYGDESMSKNYYFTRPMVLRQQKDSEEYDEIPLLESLLKNITLIDSSAKINSETSNTYKLVGKNGYNVLAILSSDDVLSKLISVD